MLTKALRLYGKRDLRLEEFELPPIGDGELLVRVVSDSICMSSYKAAEQGTDHKRVPKDAAQNPVIIGHEFCGEIAEVGSKYKDRYAAGQKFTLQPAMKGTYKAAGYSFPYLGGNCTYAIVPECYIEQDCVLLYEGDSYFAGSLAEPVSCVIGAAHASYHTQHGVYEHIMGIRQGGKMAALAACGPMGLAFIEYLLITDRKPSLLVVTDIDDARLKRAAELLPPEMAAKHGVELIYQNTGKTDDPIGLLHGLNGGNGYDDVFVYAPVAPLIEQGDAILGHDGCLNFFAGPTDTAFTAKLNFYNVHYNATHIVGTSGGNTSDMKEALTLAAAGKLNPSILLTHIGGLDAAADATLNLPKLPGAKKLIYNGISMPLTAITDFGEKGKTDPMFAALADICGKNNGLWSACAEKYLLENAKKI
ncbi:MAG: zinc-binding dehydrogenase [Defluviitaleaceae bacterium]|nr:zinc-binding dehydrogenase [Defluviitaleaceae bacterium]MCL2837403.1 zinc-binding dehydrogenase [Defluviitaleaceae bacterium]